MKQEWHKSTWAHKKGRCGRRRAVAAPDGDERASVYFVPGRSSMGKATRHECRTQRLRAVLGGVLITTIFHNRITRYLTYRDIQMLAGAYTP